MPYPDSQLLDHVEAKQFFSRILHQSPLKAPFAGEEFALLDALLARHPQAVSKIGPGVQEIYVDEIRKGVRSFFIRRTDGRVDNFSFHKCLKGERADFHRFCRAARQTLEPQIIKKKLEYFNRNKDSLDRIFCPVTRDLISLKDARVEHCAPMTFNAICKAFIESQGEEFSFGHLFYRKEKFGEKIGNTHLFEALAEFYARVAEIRLVCEPKQMLSPIDLD